MQLCLQSSIQKTVDETVKGSRGAEMGTAGSAARTEVPQRRLRWRGQLTSAVVSVTRRGGLGFWILERLMTST